MKLNRSENKIQLITKAVEKILKNIDKIKLIKGSSMDEIRGSLEGYEGNSAKVYFQAIGSLIPEKYAFENRTRNPALDSYNCMLNYSYGILYSKIEKACIIAGLDPYIGIMHTDNYNKTALVFDIIEVYRVYMDEIVFSLFSKRKIKKEMFDEVKGGGVWLNKLGKELLISSINERFEEKIKHKGRQIKLFNVIQHDCHEFANKLLKEVI